MPDILLVEDNPGDARLLRELLRENEDMTDNYSIVHVERVSDAVDLLMANNNFEIILSDITLPDSRGIDTLISLSTAADELPIIFMTGTNDEALAMTAINQGAQDYLVKGKMDGEVLSRTLKYAIERKKFQNEVNRIIANEEIIKQRVKLLAEQKQQLIKLNQSKDEFISIASHQLRTPATAVKQFVGMLIEGYAGDLTAQQLALLQKAYSSNERQLNVISELLKTAQLDASKVPLILQPLSINALITECTNNLLSVFELRHQTFSLLLGEDYTVVADKHELMLVLTNIVENASKYTPREKNITVEVERRKNKVCISVTDEGVGITEANLKIIFDKFTRVDNELSDTVSGTGLGLYWAKRIMKLHKGSIKVISRLGYGSTFTLELPA